MSQVAFLEPLVVRSDPQTQREDSRGAQTCEVETPKAEPLGNQVPIGNLQANELLRPLVLVDDDSDFHVLLEASLRAAGICEPLVGLQEGRAVMPWLERQMELGSRRPLLLLLDVHLPDRGGLDVLKDLKENPRFRNTPVMLLTSDVRDEILNQALDLGASTAVTKPTEFPALVDLVRSLARYYGILTNGSVQANDHSMIKRENRNGNGNGSGDGGNGAVRGWVQRRK
ncbi:MAG: response regulator [Candidatus Eisenbacteria bacterium]